MTITPVKPTPPRYINRPRPLRGQPKTPDVGTYPMPDCYLKQSENDAVMMKGDRSRTMRGRLRQKRGDTHLTTLAKTYPELNALMRTPGLPPTVHLSLIRQYTGEDSLSGIRAFIRRGGVPK